MAEQDTLIARFRYRRKLCLFGQQELASEIGISRHALANYETGRTPLPFAVGYALCRRLDICPRWVVEGTQPQIHWVELYELDGNIREDELLFKTRNMGFEEGYKAFLKAPLDQWFEKHSLDEIVLTQMLRGQNSGEWEKTLRNASVGLLKEWLTHKPGSVKPARAAGPVIEAHSNFISSVKGELAFRVAGKTHRKRSRVEIAAEQIFPSQSGEPLVNSSAVNIPTLENLIQRARVCAEPDGRKAELARFLGVTRSAVSRYLDKKSNPSSEKTLSLLRWVIQMEALK